MEKKLPNHRADADNQRTNHNLKQIRATGGKCVEMGLRMPLKFDRNLCFGWKKVVFFFNEQKLSIVVQNESEISQNKIVKSTHGIRCEPYHTKLL